MIVGVEPDEYSRKFKGSSRPFFTQKIRGEILSYINNIDYVVLFKKLRASSAEFVRMYRKISPEWVVFGSTEKKTLSEIESQAVESGSKFKRLPYARKLDSSSRIIRKLTS